MLLSECSSWPWLHCAWPGVVSIALGVVVFIGLAILTMSDKGNK